MFCGLTNAIGTYIVKEVINLGIFMAILHFWQLLVRNSKFTLLSEPRFLLVESTHFLEEVFLMIAVSP